ncbi:MAG TPA: STAS domain-containing protein [Chloroflexota bacterium]|nr:STAS domain-containing protein [Chloroflexota bacterium]
MEVALSVQTRIVDGKPVIDVDGEMDHTGIRQFRDEVASLIDQGHRSIVLDMCHVGFMDSGGLSAIIYAMKRLESLEGCITLAGCNDLIVRKLTIGGLTKISDALRLAQSVEHAVS